MILILGLTALNAEAQKTTIDLLPTAGESVHSEALIDTSITHDSLLRFDSLSILRDTIRETGTELSYKEDAAPVLKKRSHAARGSLGLGLKPLIFKRINPINFIFFFTALKF